MGDSLTPEERFEVFGDFDPAQYADEVEQRWGDTDAYRESRRRTGTYGKDDWARITTAGERIERRFVAAMRSGEPSDGDVATDLAEEHRTHISRWFYECGYDLHRSLGDMYLADERFRSRYEAMAPGLAQYIRDAIHANGDVAVPLE